MIEKKMFFKYLYGYNVKLQVHYIPIFLQPYYKNILNKKTKDYPVSYDFYKKEVSLPIYPLLNLNEQNYVIRLIKRYFKKPQLIKNKNKLIMKISVIGCGSIGKRHIRNLSNLEDNSINNITVYDINSESFDSIKDIQNIKTTQNINEVYENASGIIIANPNHLHSKYALEALKK